MFFLRIVTPALLVGAFLLSGATVADQPPRRAKPAPWSQDVLDAFFDDARHHLVGERPQAVASEAGEKLPVSSLLPGMGKARAATTKWSDLVTADTLTTEVKRLNIALTAALAKPAQFKGGGNLQCRRDFSVLAVLFGLISEFDREVRWQKSAAMMKSRCAHSSELCKAGSDESYAASQNVQRLLDNLIRGQAVDLAPAPADVEVFEVLPQLMQRMEQALKGNVSPSLSNASEFRKRKQAIAQDAEILALLAEVICEESHGFADDETYLGHARTLREASRKLRRAIGDGSYEAARAAAGDVSQSCSECHDGYRG